MSLKAVGCEQSLDGFGLGESDFERDEAAGNQHAMRPRESAGGKSSSPSFAGKEGKRRLVFAHFDGDECAIGVGHIGRIGDHEVELFAGNGREQIALQETDAFTHAIACRVFARDGRADSEDRWR